MKDVLKAVGLAVMIVVIILGIDLCGFISGEKSGTERTREEAVKAGVAHYEPDEAGKPKFVWGPAGEGSK